MFKAFSQVFKILRNLPPFLGAFGVAQIRFSSLGVYILSHLVYFITTFIKIYIRISIFLYTYFYKLYLHLLECLYEKILVSLKTFLLCPILTFQELFSELGCNFYLIIRFIKNINKNNLIISKYVLKFNYIYSFHRVNN